MSDYIDTFVLLEFKWDASVSDKDLFYDQEKLTATHKKGYGTALGDKAMSIGNRYFFHIKYAKGYDCYIGIVESDYKVEGVFSQSEKGWSYFSEGDTHHKGEKKQYVNEQVFGYGKG